VSAARPKPSGIGKVKNQPAEKGACTSAPS
jgi:hypothetical protein